MGIFTRQPSKDLAIILLVAVVIVAGVVSAFTFFKIPIFSASLNGGLTQPNVALHCPSGTYVADHSCVANCPIGFRPVAYDTAESPVCMSPSNWPVSVNDLAGLWVSADGGTTIYYVVETVPLAKMPDTAQVSVYLPVAQSVLDNMPTVPKMPTLTTLVATVGDKVGTFTISQINSNNVQGIFYNPYPLCCPATNRTIVVGNDIGISCEGVSIILESIDFQSQIAVFQRIMSPAPQFGCPICLSGDTVIDTPNGPVNVKSVTTGMMVWSVDRFGRRVTMTIIEIRMNPVPSGAEVVHLVLQDGRQIYASPAHPTADGRTFGELGAGGLLDNSVITIAELVPYNQAYTYDILPNSDTGFYWANGILVGSTLS
jgi:hypothetical protein